jgi:hypothetical protein
MCICCCVIAYVCPFTKPCESSDMHDAPVALLSLNLKHTAYFSAHRFTFLYYALFFYISLISLVCVICMCTIVCKLCFMYPVSMLPHTMSSGISQFALKCNKTDYACLPASMHRKCPYTNRVNTYTQTQTYTHAQVSTWTQTRKILT